MPGNSLNFVISGEKVDSLLVNLLKKAADQASEADVHVKWLKFEEIKDNIKNCIGEDEDGFIVCETFEGTTFEQLKTYDCRIVGPMTIISCLDFNMPLPPFRHPVLNVAMLDLVVCCTNIAAEERNILRNFVNQMGGEMVNDLTESVTHLVAGEVGSKKYQVACEIGSKVMQTSWIYDCCEKNKYKYIPADDKIFEKHRCPCFKGITICVTGMSANVRKDIKRLTGENGGKYSGELNMRSCTHLLVKVAKGEKYNYARQWKIHCVSPQWFFDCIKAGYWIQEDTYTVKPGENSILDESRLLNSSKTTVDVTVQSDMDISIISNRAAEVAGRWMQSREEKSIEKHGKLNNQATSKDQFNHTDDFKIKCFSTSKISVDRLGISVSDIFLDGCKLYLTGIPLELVTCLRKLINAAGAMRLSQLNESITHIILGDTLSKDVEDFLHQSIQKPYVVSPEWLIDSCQAGKHLNENEYSLIEEKTQTTFSNVSAALHEPRQKATGKVTSVNDHLPSFQVDDDLEDDVFLGQYLPQAESSRISFLLEKKTSDENCELPKIKDFEMADQSEAIAGSHEKNAENEDSAMKTKEKLCCHKKFVIKYFDEEQKTQIVSLIEQYGGILSKTEAKSDHIIVPISYEKKRRIAKKEVTVLWLEQSLEKETLLPVSSSFLFRPVYLPQDCLPLADCVLTVSQFFGMERQHLSLLAELLGAFVQEDFARKASADLRANTHLLLMEAAGTKYEAALKWGVICVSKEWLFACASKRCMVQAEKYPLKDNETDEEIEHETTVVEATTTLNETSHEISCNAERQTEQVIQPQEEVGKYYKSETARKALKTPRNSESNKRSHNALLCIESESSAAKNPFLATPSSNIKPKVQLQSGKRYKPAFELGETPEFIRTPGKYFNKQRESHGSIADESLANCFTGRLQIARKFAEMSDANGPSIGCINDGDVQKPLPNQPITSKSEDYTGNDDPLSGIVIAVSKKLANRRIELHNMASDLGADCRFVFDESCTHLIHQGKPTDALSEVRQARTQGKFIVSEHWLTFCNESNARVSEQLYPCTYNPKMSIEVIPEKRKRVSMAATPSSVSRNKTVNEENPSTISNETRYSISELLTEETTFKSSVSEESRVMAMKSIKDSEIVEDETPKKNKEHVYLALKSSPAFLADTSSLDARIEFKRHMEEIMEATKGNKEGTKRARRPLPARRLRSRQSSQRASSDSSKSSNEKKPSHEAFDYHGIEPSQGDIITYDDPAGRMEREKILAQLKAASPSQDIDHKFEPVQESKAAEEQLVKYAQVSPLAAANERLEEPEPTSTPQPPPINLQIARPIQAPEPVNLLVEEESPKKTVGYTDTHRFLLTSMTPQEKIKYSALIEDIGGVLSEAQFFTLDCTHVIAGSPNRNEKFLASVAAGKWVLHRSFLEASREAGYFVDEELHEWGSEAEPSKLSSAARRWRKKLSEERKKSHSKGAFDGWNILLCVGSSSYQHGFKRLIEAGGGVVKSTSPPFNNFDGVTHAFVDTKRSKLGSVDFQALHSAGIWVLRPEYIADYLTQDPPPPMMKYIIPEVRKLGEQEGLYMSDVSINDTKKRKNEDLELQKSKRVKN